MKASTTKVEEHVALNMKGSGATLLTEVFKFSKTIGKTVAAKKGLVGEEASNYAASVQRCLRRARIALENRS